MKRKLIIGIVIALVILIPIGWYLASPLFINERISEESPTENTIESNIDYQGSFSGADSFHQVKGKVLVLSDGNNKYLRLEEFESTNGPDLKVYLSEDLDANSYVSLGDLKANIGNQNYNIPDGTDINKYKYALIWCEQFSVLFGQAELSEIQ